jgi:co-chaperonin GroES (HSP10)
MNLQPNDDRVLVRPWKEDKLNGLHLPTERKKEAISMGQVIACGPGLRREGELLPMRCKVGDTILYDTRAGLELRADSKVLLFLHDSQVVAFVRAEESEPALPEKVAVEA